MNEAARALAGSVRRGDFVGGQMSLARAAEGLGLVEYGEGASVDGPPVLVALNDSNSIDILFGLSYRERLELWGDESRSYLFCLRLEYVASVPEVTVENTQCPDDRTVGDVVSAERAGLSNTRALPST